MSLTRVLLLTLPVAFTRYKGCEEWCQNRCSELNGPFTIECGNCDDTMSCYPGASDFSSHHGETKVYNEERQGETNAYYQRAVNARPIPMATVRPGVAMPWDANESNMSTAGNSCHAESAPAMQWIELDSSHAKIGYVRDFLSFEECDELIRAPL